MRGPRRVAFVAAATLTAAIAVAPTAAQAPFQTIVAFGASLSDSGNAFALRGGTNTPPDYLLDPLLVPSAPYARGGHHFSNGATWVEQFARSRGLAASVRPAYASASQATNFAVGGARAHEDGININLPAQVGAFLAQVGGHVPAGTLVTIEMGGNDIRDALFAYATGGDGGAILNEAVTSIAQNIQVLYGAGARDFLLWNSPDLGLTPAIRRLDAVNPGSAQGASQLTDGFNAGLAFAVVGLSGLPQIRITRLDAYALLNKIVAHPADFGLANATTACVRPDVQPFMCDSPDDFLFWDGIHPTKAGHAIIAQEAATVLSH